MTVYEIEYVTFDAFRASIALYTTSEEAEKHRDALLQSPDQMKMLTTIGVAKININVRDVREVYTSTEDGTGLLRSLGPRTALLIMPLPVTVAKLEEKKGEEAPRDTLLTAVMFYYGCYNHEGHYLYNDHGRTVKEVSTPFKYTALDGGFCPGGGQEEGKARLAHDQGWTVLSFWDRSLDNRRGSHSTFVMQGTWNFEQMVETAARRFPTVWHRITKKFPVRLKTETCDACGGRGIEPKQGDHRCEQCGGTGVKGKTT